jgi:micrococcal nuclease
MTLKTSYNYKATITNVVDGDTVDALVDLGFTVFVQIRFRLNGIDTPELNSKVQEERKLALEAKQFVIDKCLNKKVMIQSHKTDKYGRWLADIYVDNYNLNQQLLDEQLAIPYNTVR